VARGRGRPPKDGADRARERILEAAIALFSDRGFAGTSVSAICERADVGKPALYWHFDSKEGLLAAVLDAVAGSWIEELQKETAPHGNPGQRLRRLTDEWRRIILERPQQLTLPLVAQLEQGDASHCNRELLTKMVGRAEGAMVEGIEQSMPGLELPDLDLVARVAVTLLQGALLRHRLDQDEANLDRFLEEVRRTVSLLVWARLPAEARRNLLDWLDSEVLGPGSEGGATSS